MSLYNLVCGNNPLFGLYARILETAGPMPEIPRFRDMYTREDNGKIQIVLYTRTGGGNRESYEDQNNALTEHPLFVKDFDDDYDSTFAHWVYSVPEAYAERMQKLHRTFSRTPKGLTPGQKFQKQLAALEGKEHESCESPIDAEMDELGTILESLVAELPEQSGVEKQLVG